MKIVRQRRVEPLVIEPVSGERAQHLGTANPKVQIPPVKRSVPMLQQIFGFLRAPAIAAVAAGALIACTAAQGAPLEQDLRFDVLQTSEQMAPNQDLARALDDLGERLRRGEITVEQFDRAKRTLASDAVLMRDHRGRIDVDALIVGLDASDGRSRGDLVMERLIRGLEQRMRVTARDMANPDTRFLEGTTVYKEVPADELRDLVVDALKDMPIEELPFGEELARLLPAGVTPEMSYREIEDHLEGRAKDWWKREVAPRFEGIEIETGVLAMAAITGLRAASPDAAEVIDGLSPRVTLWRARTEDGNHDVRARLAWRDRHVFPQLDLVGTSNTTVSRFDLRAELDGTLAPEDGERPVRGSFTLGARMPGDGIWADSRITRELDRDRTHLNLTVGGYDPETRFSHATSLTATVGEDAALGDASGRVWLDVDLAKPVRFNGAEGTFGIYLGASADTDGKHEDFRAGLVLQLRF